MFQYSLLLTLQEEGLDARGDTSEYDHYRLHNGFELGRVFSLRVEEGPREIVARSKRSKSLVGMLRRAGRRISNLPESHLREGSFPEEWIKNPPVDWRTRDVYLDGYWQSERFLPADHAKIRSTFSFPAFTSVENKKLAEEIENTDSVSLHFRGGDYLASEHLFRKYGSVCGRGYYKRALDVIGEVCPKARVYVFSNDTEWVRKNLELGSSPRFVEHNGGQQSFRDMQLMSLCKHNIIANSSFSWWGAWLNQNPYGRVVSPALWTGDGKAASAVVPSDWIQIPAGQ
jgi:hypothetical protein